MEHRTTPVKKLVLVDVIRLCTICTHTLGESKGEQDKPIHLGIYMGKTYQITK